MIRVTILRYLVVTFFVLFLSMSSSVSAADTDSMKDQIAKDLQNPVAMIISVPFQNNWDFGIGPDKAYRYTLNFQPVIPLSISSKWNLIIRTILPVIHAESPAPGISSKSGLGDILQSFFFSPKETVLGGWIIGAGPVFLYPNGTDGLSARKWGAGPTAVVLKQGKELTYGMLANHVWSFAGSGISDVSATFLQPFISYQTKIHTIFSLNSESTYDWKQKQWTVPINLAVTQVLTAGGHPFSFALGGRYYPEKPSGGPD